jgi:CBS domain-containing protein
MRLTEVGVGSIVVEDGMQPVGTVTDRDIPVRVAARDSQGSTPGSAPARHVRSSQKCAGRELNHAQTCSLRCARLL